MCLVSGETSGKGFYLYDNKRKATPDPEVKKYIERARSIAGVAVDPKVSFLHHRFYRQNGSNYGLYNEINFILTHFF